MGRNPRPKKTDEQRKREKYTAYLRATGRPVKVSPDRATAYVRRLHDDFGMSYNTIAITSGLSYGTLHAIAHGQLGEIFRTTEEALLAVEPEAPMGRDHGNPGARVSPVPTVRRLNSLALQGFPLVFIAELISMPFPTLSALTKKEKFIFAATEIKVREAYEKLNHSNPLDHGVSEESSRRAIVSAKMRGAIPEGCWDAETIGDPDAFPEWTGACGTEEGYRIHLRENIDVCDACNNAVGGGTAGDRMIFSAWKFRQLVEQRKLSYAKLGPMLGVTEDTARRWALGNNSPQTRHYETILHVLDAEPEEVFDMPEGVDYITEGDFNRHKLRLAMEQHEIGMHALSKMTGVSHTTLHNWVAGNKIPQTQNVKKVADYFGVDWKVFYG